MSQQIFTDQGGFKIYTPIANNATWASSINITADSPIPLPFRFFFDAGVCDGLNVRTKNIDLQESFVYEAGITFSLVKDVAEVYFPLVASKSIMNYFDINKYGFAERIRFKFDIAKLNPLLLRKQISN